MNTYLVYTKNVVTKFFSGHERTVKLKSNIVASIGTKAFSIVLSFVLVPLTLSYLDSERYGIWITMTSMLNWINFFDIGLGNGLRNRLAESLAVNNKKLAKTYVSTTYAILILVIGSFALCFFIVNPHINWAKILNVSDTMRSELTTLSTIVFGFFFIRFVLKLVTTVLYADQRTGLGNIFNPLANFVSLIFIYLLTKYTNGSLLLLGVSLSISPVIILTIATIYFFSRDYREIRPNLKFVDMKYSRMLLNLGVKFFLIQISGLILYQSSNIIIAHNFGPQEVTPYNIAYKYFSLINMGFTIIVTPFWSAYTEAYVKRDFQWIKRSVRKLLNIWVILVIFAFMMLLGAKTFYKLWIGTEILIPYQLSFFMAIYFIIFTFGGIFTMFINGVGKLKIQLYASLIGSISFLPISFVLIRIFHLGIVSLVIASICCNFNGLIFAPIQYNKIMNKKAKGIWNQ